MANSYVEYSESGTGTNGMGQKTFSYNSIDVLSADHIYCRTYSGSSTQWASQTIASRDASAKTITLASIPPSGTYIVRVYRDTVSTPLVDFVDGARLTESDLDTAYKQGLLATQEVKEDAAVNGNTGVANLSLTGTTSVQNLTASGVVRIFNNPNANHFYRTGTWSPDITINGSSVVDIPNSTKDYTKIGRVVFISAHIVLSTGIPNGAFTITGLPFSVVSRGTMSMSVLDSSASYSLFDQMPTSAVDESGDDIVCDTAGISYGVNDRINLTGFYFTS